MSLKLIAIAQQGPPGAPGENGAAVTIQGPDTADFNAVANAYHRIHLPSGDIHSTLPTAVGVAGDTIELAIESTAGGNLIVETEDGVAISNGIYASGFLEANLAGTVLTFRSNNICWVLTSFFTGF